MTETARHNPATDDDGSATTPAVLHYARGRPRPHAWQAALLFGMGGLVVNTFFVYAVVGPLHWSSYAYHDLRINPRAYGRPISPDMIEVLRVPLFLWIASAAMLFAAAFGLLLALHLLRFAWNAPQPLPSTPGIAAQYRRWKPAGTAITVIASFWFGIANLRFMVIATQHVPVGSGTSYIDFVEMAVLAFGALLPWWWLRGSGTGKI